MINILNDSNNYFKYRYLLVDNLVALQDEYPLSQESLLANLGAERMTPVLRTDLTNDPDFFPTLITLAKPGQFFENILLDYITQQASIECFWSKRYICAVIVTDLEPKVLADKLVHIGNIIAKTLQEPYYPFFEPFRMEFLHQIGAIEDQRWLFTQLAGIDHYFYPSIFHGHLVNYSLDMNGDINGHWSQQYTQRLAKFRVIRTLVNAWANNRTRRESEQGLPLADDVIMQSTKLVEQAMELGLTNYADILFWGLNGLTFKVDFTQYPEALDIVEKAKKLPGTLSQGFVDTEETIWKHKFSAHPMQ